MRDQKPKMPSEHRFQPTVWKRRRGDERDRRDGCSHG